MSVTTGSFANDPTAGIDRLVQAAREALTDNMVERLFAFMEHMTNNLATEEVAELGAPPFVSIANDPQTYDPKELQARLRQPHWPMQQFVLSERDVDNLLAFIASLRKD